MADVVRPSAGLENKLMDLNRRRSSDWLKTISSTVAGTAEGLQNGIGAGVGLSRQMFSSPQGDPGIAPLDKAKMQKDVADAIAKYAQESMDQKLSFAQKMAKQDELIKAVLSSAQGVTTGIASANASVASSLNSALANINGNFGQLLAKTMEKQSPQNMAAITKAFDDIVAAAGGVEGSGAQGAVNAIDGLMTNLTVLQGDPAGAAALVQAVDGQLERMGIAGGVQGYLTALAQNGVPQAGSALDTIQRVMATQEYNNGALLKTGFMDKIATTEGLRGGVGGADKFLPLVQETLKLLGENIDNPEKLPELIDQISQAGPGGETTPLETYEKLLADLDQDNLPPASNLAEARRRFLADPEFQAWMQQNGLTDPGMALKELRRLIAEKRATQRAQTRETVAQRRAAGVTAQTGPSASADLVDKGTGPSGQPAVPGEATFVTDEDGNLWYFSPESGMRPATDDDVTKIDAKVEAAVAEGKDPDEAWGAQIAPASQFQSLQQGRSSRLIGQARETAATNALPAREAAVGTMAPDTSAGIRGLFKPKKPKQAPIGDSMLGQLPDDDELPQGLQ